MTTITRPGEVTKTAAESEQRPRYTGQGMPRIDGLAKATGAARYTFDLSMPDMVYGVVVGATIAHGTVRAVDHAPAQAISGVLLVLSAENCPPTPAPDPEQKPFVWFNPTIDFDGQPVAFVVATTRAAAEDGARALRISYDTLPHHATLRDGLAVGQSEDPDGGNITNDMWGAHYRRGDVAVGWAESTTRIEAEYAIAPEAHTPWETFATLAHWTGDMLTVYESTQTVDGIRGQLATALGVNKDQVRVIAEYIGGGFGAKFDALPQCPLAAFAARQLGRPVKAWLSREQAFRLGRYRPATIHQLRIGATADGQLRVIDHTCQSQGAIGDDYYDYGAMTARFLYASPHVASVHRIVRTHFVPPTAMRGPGVFQAQFALESAMDELANQLGIDPIALRRLNQVFINPMTEKPYSTQSMLTCLDRGATLIGWGRRAPTPATPIRSGIRRGLGVAVAYWPTFRGKSTTGITLDAEGSVIIRTSSVDIGTGQYTILAQVAADALGVDPQDIVVRLGDTTLPTGIGAGGSMAASATANATHLAALALRERILTAALAMAESPFAGCVIEDLTIAGKHVTHRADKTRAITLATLARANDGAISTEATWKPEQTTTELADFGAHFAEVEVDCETGQTRVVRFVAVHDSGRVLNANTFRNQLYGGIIWGISAALMEELTVDARQGRMTNASLAGYHIPTALDIDDITVEWIDEPDTDANALGVKGVGEVGITGTAPAIGNAIANATGVRLRSIPFTPRRVLEALFAK